GDGPAGHHRLRRGQPPRQRDHEHPRGPRATGLLPGREGLALPEGRAPLGADERRLRLVPLPAQGGPSGQGEVPYSVSHRRETRRRSSPTAPITAATASGAGFTPAQRAGGLGGAPLAPPSSPMKSERSGIHSRAASGGSGGVRR